MDLEDLRRRPSVAAFKMTDEDTAMYHEAFNVFDRNRSGKISLNELGDVMVSMGQERPSEVGSFTNHRLFFGVLG